MKTKTLVLLALTFCSYLPANTYLDSTAPPMKPQTEFEQLTIIMAKYGNNAEGIQAINYAILQQDEAAVDLLLKYGATLGGNGYNNYFHYGSNNSFYYAIKTGSLALVKKLIGLGLDPHGYINDRTLLHIAIYEHQNDIAKYLINYGLPIEFEYRNRDSIEYLIDCAEVGNMEIYNLLVSKRIKYSDRSNFLHKLMRFRDQRHMCNIKKIEMLSDLLNQYLIDPNELVGGTPFFYLATDAEYGQYSLEMLNILFNAGANASALDSRGDNVFTYSGFIQESQEYFDTQKEIIHLLVKHGADINHKDAYGNSLLQKAKGSRMITFLKSLGAK